MTDDYRQPIAEKYRTILLIGPPGSGKGTQGRILGEVPGYWLLSMGKVLRSLEPSEDPGREIQPYLQAGDLVPAELVIAAWSNHVDGLAARGFQRQRDVLVLDGMPRNIEQAEMLGPHIQIEWVVHLACDDEAVLMRRIHGREQGRADDTRDQVIQHRFEVYQKQTAPLLDHYPRNLVTSVKAASTPMSVLQQIAKVLS